MATMRRSLKDMSAGHFINKCEHGVVMGQCRCFNPNKSVRIVPCKHKGFPPPAADAPRVYQRPYRSCLFWHGARGQDVLTDCIHSMAFAEDWVRRGGPDEVW